MKTAPEKQQEHLFFLASENVFIHVNRPYKIQTDMIETRNFVPGALVIHCFHELNKSGFDCYNFLRLPQGEMLMPLFDPELRNSSALLSALESPFLKDDDDDKDDEDWDEEDDEDWDEDEDEDWDEDEDEDWEDDEDEDWEDDDEEWDDEDDESSDEEE